MRKALFSLIILWVALVEAAPLLRLSGSVRSVASFKIKTSFERGPASKRKKDQNQFGIYLNLSSNDRNLGRSQNIIVREKAFNVTTQKKLSISYGQTEVFIPFISEESEVAISFIQN